MSSRTKTILSFVIFAAVLGGGIAGRIVYEKNARTAGKSSGEYTVTQVVVGDGTTLNAKVADTPALEERGLSGTAGLGENEAMLFVFDKQGLYPFWMKDMNYPIDMIWMDQEHHVVYIKEHATPGSYPEQFVSQAPALFVLEVQDGFVAKHNIKIADELYFNTLSSTD